MPGKNPSCEQATGRDKAARRVLHGRRQGRPLRRGRRRLLDDLLPGIAVDPPQPGKPLDPGTLFAGTKEAVWLEIGFGAGEHLAWQAERNPTVGILGAEYYVNGIAALLRRVEDGRLDNVRVWQGDARALLDVLPAHCLHRVFVLFPDPWPKTRHHKRRIVQADTLTGLARLMCVGAELRVATDDRDYQRWILEHATRHPSFEWLAEGPDDWRTRPDDWPPTRYEQKALAQGRRPAFFRFRRQAREAG